MIGQPPTRGVVISPNDAERIAPLSAFWVRGRGDLRVQHSNGQILTYQFNEPDIVQTDETGREHHQEPTALIPLLNPVVRIFATGTTVAAIVGIY